MKESEIIKPPAPKYCGENSKGVLVVDDMVESGRSSKISREHMPHAKIATVYGKPDGLEHIDIHAVDVPQETWLHFPWDIEPARRPPLVGPDS